MEITGRHIIGRRMEKAPEGDVDSIVVRSMLNTGLAYWQGNGVKQDFEEAKYWLSRAESLGDIKAHRMLKLLVSNPYSAPTLSRMEAINKLAFAFPVIALPVCRLAVGLPAEASHEGLVAYWAILLLGAIFSISRAINSRKMGVRRLVAALYAESAACIVGAVYMVGKIVG
jgi:hypothetical protein